MRWVVIVFWVAVVAALVWNGMALVNGVVREAYHPLSAAGDALHPFRTFSLLIPVVTGIALADLRHPKKERLYGIGLCVLLIGAVLPVLPRPMRSPATQ